MSPRVKRVLSIGTLLCSALLGVIFLVLMIEEGDMEYLFFLAPLLVQMGLSIDYLKELNRKIKLSNDLKREEEYLKADSSIRHFAETADDVTWSATPPMRNVEEEQDIAELLRSQNVNQNQNYRG